ncbi:hypothetical protein HMPREF0880_01546 [Yokenella regensburgei ATCC 43003]|nr:hypothetical protein HMPREF0880_01546 [Yokenella regensburgei ATCC 43003]
MIHRNASEIALRCTFSFTKTAFCSAIMPLRIIKNEKFYDFIIAHEMTTSD